ncbi:MAG: Trm112 family protein [Candidatus Heimdallarchaeaceae archaeon]
MKHRLMDLLACPIDKSWPLKLEIAEEVRTLEKISIPLQNEQTEVVCNYYCNFLQFQLIEISDNGEERIKEIDEIKKHVSLKECQECFKIEIQSGKLYCSHDENHQFDIKESIPVMLTEQQLKKIYGRKRK